MLDCVLVDLRKILKKFRGVLPRASVLALLCAGLATFPTTALAQEGSFVPAGSLATATSSSTATLLNNGMVLIAGGQGTLSRSALASAELYNPATGTFTSTGGMNTAREAHTATLLNNGMVLIAGGLGSINALASAELYDPATGTFTPTGSMNTTRAGQTATLLNNGTVLMAGGGPCPNGGCLLATAELYDPATGTFTPTGSMNTARVGNSATLLNNGTVLVAGGEMGFPGNYLASAELYDPATGVFTLTGNMNTARFSQAATLLTDGKVLVAGGIGSLNALASAELYDPATGTFTPTGSMNTARWNDTATLLNNGIVLVAGGLDSGGDFLASAESYDPTTGAFTPTGSMNTTRAAHTATLLSNGTVLIAGGYDTASVLAGAEVYELVAVLPASLSFSDQVINVKSASQSVTLTNNQSTALSITNVAIGGTNAPDFAETNNCLGSVAAGASCLMSVTFTPAAAGSRTGSLTISNTLSSSMLTVPLGGTGLGPAPIVSLSTNGVVFAIQAIGTTSAAQTVTVRNTGNASLSIQTVALAGANAGDFAITNSSTCTNGTSVAINGSCIIQLTFTPTGTGARSATVSLQDNAADSPETISLSGNGPAPAGAGVSLSPTTVTFPGQYVGTSGLPQTVTVTSTSNTAPLSVTSVTASPADFGFINNCTNPVSQPNSCTIGVFFDPAAGGTRTGTLTITNNAGNSPQTVSLTGSGLDFSMTPGAAASATVTAGQTASFSIAVAPAGGFAASVALSCSGGPAGSACAVSPSTIALSGAAAQTAMVTVTTAAHGWLLPFHGGWPREMRHRQIALG